MHAPNSPALKTAVRRIRSLAGPADTTSDRELLARFRRTRDDRAFAALVTRHGPAVLGVCRRTLGDADAAEDAFQATFLVLARRAAAVRNPAALGCWLHGVAVRVSMKLKAKLARRPRSVDAIEVPTEPSDDVLWRDVRRVLDEELGRLPDRLRLPVFLCYFEGKTRDEAADALGWKVSTLRGRLEDGRLRLRGRLALRGIELSAALLAVSAAVDGLAVSETLLESTVGIVGGVASATARSLATGIAVGGTLGKAKLTVGALLLAVGLGTTLLGYRGAAGQPPPPGPALKTAEPPTEKKPAKNELIQLMEAADRVWVVDSPTDEKPVPEPVEVLKGLTPPDAKYSFRLNAEVLRDLPRKGHRWVVFLRCVEETDRALQIVPLPGGKWFVPADEATLAALRQYVPPCQWGDASDGLRLGLHVRPDADEPTVEVVLQNVGTKDLNILQFLVPTFDDWPHLSFTVTGPDGKAWRLERTGRAYKDSPPPNNRVLKAGDRYIHPVRIGRWAQPTSLAEHGNAPPGLFAEGGDFRIEATYQLTDGHDPTRWWIGKLTSGPAKLAVPKPGPWGEAVEGVRARLRLGTTKYRSGDSLTFDLDLKNEGRRPATPDADPFACEVFIDNERYTYTGPIDRKVHARELKPGAELVPFVTATVDALWQARRTRGRPEDYSPPVSGFVPFRLTPGKHTVRVAFPLAGDKVRAVSNAIEIDVEAVQFDDATRAMAQGADRIWVVPSPTKEAPTPKPDAVLKGPPADAGRGRIDDLGRLPADDPKKKWIVFLKSEDEGQSVARVQVWHWTNWSRPYTPELAEAIRQAFLPTEWGPETDGLKFGLRLRSAEVMAGQPVPIEVTIRNVGKVAKEIHQHRYNIYDYWPRSRFEVTAPDGTKWLLARSEPSPDKWQRAKTDGTRVEPDAPTTFTLKPGETYTQAMHLDRWPADPAKPTDGKPKANLFTQPGTYTITARYSLTPGGPLVTWTAALKSNAVKLIVKADPKEGEWSEPVGGVSVRLRMPKTKLKFAEDLAVELDLKNAGDTALATESYPERCVLHLDGKIYWQRGFLSGLDGSKSVRPGEEVVPFVKSHEIHGWSSTGDPNDGQLLPLGPGKHRLRVSYQVADKVEPLSKEIEFEVGLPDEWGESAGGIQARLRLAKSILKVGEPLTFELDLKNTGSNTYEVGPIPQHCEIRVDEDSFKFTGPLDITTPVSRLTPGKEFAPYIKVTVDRSWKRFLRGMDPPRGSFEGTLVPGKHLIRVAYPLPGMVKPVSPAVEIEVVSDQPATLDLPQLVAAADRIVVAKIDKWKAKTPKLIAYESPLLRVERVLKGPNNRWQPDALPLAIPPGTDFPDWFEGLTPDRPAVSRILFLRVEEDGTEVPKLVPLTRRNWFRPATDKDIAAVLAALPPVVDSGPMKNGLSLALRPTASKVKLGEDVRLEVVLSNGSKEPIRVLQQRYNVYDYWPFLKFTVTDPAGRTMVLAKPAGQFTREDFVDDIELKGGQQYAHAVRLYNWPVQRRPDPKDDGLPKATFRQRGKYTITATYTAPTGFPNLRPDLVIKKWPFWNGELTSNTVTVEVTGPFDEVRRVVDATNPRIYIVLTAPTAGPAELAGLVVKHAGDALDEADTWHVSPRSIVFFIRKKPGDDRGYVSSFDRQQLEAIKNAKPDEAKKLAGEHAWSLGKLPGK